MRGIGIKTKVLLAAAALGFAGFVVVLSESALHIPAYRHFAAHAEVAARIANSQGATWREVSVLATDGARLAAWEFRPPVWNGSTVLLLHGHFDTREGPAGMAPIFLRHGYAVLVPDNRGHGASGGAEVTYGIRERTDVARWVDASLAEPGSHRVYALGESMGAAILLQALPREPRIRAVVAEGAFSGFRSVAYQRVGRWYGLPDALTGLLVEPAFLYIRTRYGLSLTDADPLAAVRETHTPILYIHGTGDTNIPSENSASLYAARKEGSVLWQPAGATHTAASTFYPEEFERRVIGWFEQH